LKSRMEADFPRLADRLGPLAGYVVRKTAVAPIQSMMPKLRLHRISSGAKQALRFNWDACAQSVINPTLDKDPETCRR